jgi:hypothetical protein
MKNRFGLFIITVAVLIMTAAFVSTKGATSDPFVGKWASTDTDGSYQILTVGGGSGSSYHTRVYDFGASTCGLDPETGDFLYAASIEGTLSLSNGRLSGTLPLYCHTTPPTIDGYVFLQYLYDPATNTLVDSFGVVWSH